MKCSVCKNDLLHPATLEMEMPAYQCDKCEGIWIPSNDYLAWLKSCGVGEFRKEVDDSRVSVLDVASPKFCPTCNRIMRRYKVLPNVELYLDRCSHCNGVWCDKHEWKVLLANGLQDKINLLFTQPWQTKLHEEETKSALEKMYLEKFGTADYARIKEIREWLKDHPQRAMLIAYLQADNPYKM